MIIFDANSFRNSETVINEFRNHTRTSNLMNKQLIHDIVEMIITYNSNNESISLKELRKIILDKITLDHTNEEIIFSKIHDMYSQYEMICKNESRKKLGLKFAIYQGGLRDDSRLFCIERNNKCFSEQEIEEWKHLSFAGKPENYNPFYDCGGINCAHRLDWISDQLAKRLRPDLF